MPKNFVSAVTAARPVSLAAMLTILDRDALALLATAPRDALRLALLASLLRQGVAR